MSSDSLQELKSVRVIRALVLYTSGNSIDKACELAGISESTLRRAIDENKQLVTDFIDSVRAPLQEQFVNLITAQATLVKGLIAKADNPDLPIKDALALELRFRELSKILTAELQLLPEEEPNTSAPLLPTQQPEAAAEAETKLSGPKLLKSKSIFVERTTIEIRDNNEAPGDVIEGKINP